MPALASDSVRTLESNSDPNAVILWGLQARLAAINGGQSKEHPHALIAEGLKIIRDAPKPTDRDTWAVLVAAETAFLHSAAVSRPSLLASAIEFERVLVRERVNVLPRKPRR